MTKSELPEFNEPFAISILNNDFALETVCYKCCVSYQAYYDTREQITGFEKDFKNNELCEVCGNKRFIPTDVGQTILWFLERHSK